MEIQSRSKARRLINYRVWGLLLDRWEDERVPEWECYKNVEILAKNEEEAVSEARKWFDGYQERYEIGPVERIAKW